MGFLSGETMPVHRSTKKAPAHSAPASNGRENPAVAGASAVPAARGDRIRCAACRALNPPTNRFCSECGHGLWEPCYRCRTPNAATEKFCGSCGANLFDWLHEQLGRLDEDLETARRLEHEGRYSDALGILRRIAAIEDSRLRDFAARASERMTQCAAQFRTWQDKALAAEKIARDCIAGRDYQQALLTLEAVPPGVRTEASSGLLEVARLALQDIGQLSGEIRSLSQGAITPESLAKVGRLLALQPDHPEAKELAARIAARLIEVGKSRLAKSRYQEVKKILDRVPEALLSEPLQAVRDLAWELTYLAWELRSAPWIDECLLELAARFRRLAPQDYETAGICVDLEELFRGHVREIDRFAPAWATLPENAAVGWPVEWATGLGRIELDPELDPSLLLQNPGRFAVACGAALQGLGEATIEVNLLPEEERLWRRAVRWLSKRRAQSAWGLDLGSSGIKAVRLTRGEDPSDPVVLTACDLVEHEKILSQAASESQQRSLIEASVGVFFAKNEATADRVCLSLPPKSVWVRQMEMPAMEPARLDAAMQYAGVGAFPVALADLEWRYAVLDDTATLLEPPGKLQVAIFGVNRLMLKGWLAAMQGMGLRIDEVVSDCLALHNFVCYAHRQPDSEDRAGAAASTAPLAVLDVGADATNIVVSGPDWAWFRTSGLGSDRVSKALVRQFRIPFAKAEQWKRSPASAVNTAAFFDTIRPVFEDLFQETKTELEVFREAYPERPVQRILAVGGGFRLHGLFRYLWLRE